MPTIGLIDDKKAQRESAQTIISNYLKRVNPEWEVLDIYPFQNIDDYVSWIGENDIAVLILDEQLTGEESAEGWNVDYDGHNLIEFLRRAYPTFPIFAMTAFGTKTQELLDRYYLFEDILEDKDFYSNPEQNIERFIRSGQRFTETNMAELKMVSEVSQALAEGRDVDPDDLSYVKAIQERLGLPFSIDSLKNRSEAVDQLTKELDALESLVSDIKQFLKK